MKIACFHIADFPAWVQQQLAPEQRFVAVYEEERIVARSPELRAAGLHLGEDLDRVRERFPFAQFYRRDANLERAVWEDVLYLLNEVSANIVSPQPGWALLDSFDERGLELLNRSMDGHVGIAGQRFTAMLAALRTGRGEIVRVGGHASRAFVEQSPVRSLKELGFDKELVERLELFGLYTIGRVGRLTRRRLKAQFGAQGGSLFDLLHPEVEEYGAGPFQAPPVLAVSHEFERPAADAMGLAGALERLVDLAVRGLGGRQAQLLTVRLIGGDDMGAVTMRRILKAPTARGEHFTAVAERLLAQMMPAEYCVETMVLELGGLVRPRRMQAEMAASRPAIYLAAGAAGRRATVMPLRAVITDPDTYLAVGHPTLEIHPAAPRTRSSVK